MYVYRLNRQLNKVRAQEYLGKINGATGTFGAHLAACPDVDWVAVSREFVTNRMGLTWNPLTTQIESLDWQAELYGTISHTNRILHNLCVDVWMYISRGCSPRFQSRVLPDPPPCRTRSIRFVSKTRKPIWRSPARCSTRCPQRWSNPVGSAI